MRACMSGDTSISVSIMGGASSRAMTMATACVKSMSIPWKGSGRSCGVGYARIGASPKRNSRCTWVSSSSCTTCASGVKRCCLRSLSCWSHKTLESNKSVHDKPRSGRPSTLRPEERDIALQYLKEEPHALKRVGKRFADKTDKRLSLSSLKRLAKKARLRWKRVRKSLKSLRDPDAFAQAKRELEVLQQQEDHGQIALYYFDESGFALDPTIPYAWQEPKRVIE